MHGRTIEEMTEGTYHLHGKTGNSGRKIKSFATFRLGSFRKQAMQFFPTAFFKACSADLDILYLIFIARRSPTVFFVYAQDFLRCSTNADCRLADWQVNEVKIVVKYSNRFPIPKLDFVEDLKV